MGREGKNSYLFYDWFLLLGMFIVLMSYVRMYIRNFSCLRTHLILSGLFEKLQRFTTVTYQKTGVKVIHEPRVVPRSDKVPLCIRIITSGV